MNDLQQQLAREATQPDGREGIAKLVTAHLGASAQGSFNEYFQYFQNSGDIGGPATDGGAFWQNIFRQYEEQVDPDQ